MSIIQKPLPPFCFGGQRDQIAGSAIHYASCINVDKDRWSDPVRVWQLFHDLNLKPSLRRFFPRDQYVLNPYRDKKNMRSYASVDGLILRDGDYWDFESNGRKCYHAGNSLHKGREDCNEWMTSYELIAAPQVYDTKLDVMDPDQLEEMRAIYGFNEKMYKTLAELQKADMEKHGFGIDDIMGHDVLRKNYKVAHPESKDADKPDPGDDFDHEYHRSLILLPQDLIG